MYIRVKLQFLQCTTGPFKKCIPDELRQRVWTLNVKDADL